MSHLPLGAGARGRKEEEGARSQCRGSSFLLPPPRAPSPSSRARALARGLWREGSGARALPPALPPPAPPLRGCSPHTPISLGGWRATKHPGSYRQANKERKGGEVGRRGRASANFIPAVACNPVSGVLACPSACRQGSWLKGEGVFCGVPIRRERPDRPSPPPVDGVRSFLSSSGLNILSEGERQRLDRADAGRDGRDRGASTVALQGVDLRRSPR
jgi:hypothetical protein